MKNQTAIRVYGTAALILTGWLAFYPPFHGSGQEPDIVSQPDIYISSDPLVPYDISELKHDIEKLRHKEAEIIKEKLSEKTKVVIKPVKVPVKVPRDSAAIWLRHPDGSVERIVFSTNSVPIINLVADTITDTVKLKRKWVLFGPYREF